MRELKEIKYQPGYEIDWSGDDPVIRDASGNIIATDLQISEEDFEKLKAEILKTFRSK